MSEKSTFSRGDMSPEGYTAWHEWAKVQHANGLRQLQCSKCLKWFFPQEKCGCKVKEDE